MREEVREEHRQVLSMIEMNEGRSEGRRKGTIVNNKKTNKQEKRRRRKC